MQSSDLNKNQTNNLKIPAVYGDSVFGRSVVYPVPSGRYSVKITFLDRSFGEKNLPEISYQEQQDGAVMFFDDKGRVCFVVPVGLIACMDITYPQDT